ncbi:probable ubiquitin carboxyl-terminal hydrolase MINDY-4 isoform X2 [Salvelinus fontinalis]|uniref:probable ubiquitin carboxyl-terminal hydrolase MINDY-4 isoform X2 n=1 Tax=Salvelinus fontinalis TaxID=8038 RepID=UPI002485AC76|nr:probable ubiquitin carboxyl-terminal hydrolase MINDY-4 isoform X2 [Salvelinus fontinalis]
MICTSRRRFWTLMMMRTSRVSSPVSFHSSSLSQPSSDSQPMSSFLDLAAVFCSAEWRCQSFTFSDTPDLGYGIVQKKELANLLRCGRAVLNVFNNHKELDSGTGNLNVSREQEAGSNLKTPKFPLWVVCIESHFSVLFGVQEDLLSDQCGLWEFDLYYYDGLANQQEEICLTLEVPQEYLPAAKISTLISFLLLNTVYGQKRCHCRLE